MSSRVQPGEIPSVESRYPIGVIIPTYNRSEVLLRCLHHLEQQSETNFEVIVVDDGSTDSTSMVLQEYQRHTPLHLSCIRQENAGPARARNLAISALKAPLCVMIGDDIFASPDFIAKHLELHRQKPAIQVAGLGLTRWSQIGQRVTRFMRWLDESGVQFAYHDLMRGAAPDWRHFYTSNLSLKTQFLRENRFHEGFTKAAAEDLELGYRLEQQHGLEMVFIPDAIADHLHPTNFRQACRRNFNVGMAMRLFHDLWPDSVLPSGSSPWMRSVRDWTLRSPWMLPPLTAVADIVTGIWCPNPLMRGALSSYYRRGYEAAGSSLKKPRTVVHAHATPKQK